MAPITLMPDHMNSFIISLFRCNCDPSNSSGGPALPSNTKGGETAACIAAYYRGVRTFQILGTIFQLVSGTVSGWKKSTLLELVPSNNQTPIWPLAWFCQTRSG